MCTQGIISPERVSGRRTSVTPESVAVLLAGCALRAVGSVVAALALARVALACPVARAELETTAVSLECTGIG